jgi:hypothetical protein
MIMAPGSEAAKLLLYNESRLLIFSGPIISCWANNWILSTNDAKRSDNLNILVVLEVFGT